MRYRYITTPVIIIILLLYIITMSIAYNYTPDTRFLGLKVGEFKEYVHMLPMIFILIILNIVVHKLDKDMNP